MKLQITVLATALIAVGAQAHQVDFSGGNGSGASLIFDALTAQNGQVQGLIVQTQPDGTGSIFREDDTTALKLQKDASGIVSVKVYMKHGRPLGPDSDYGVGNEMDIIGDANSNAGLITKALIAAQTNDATIKATQYTATDLRLERKEASVDLTCFDHSKPRADQTENECEINTN